MTAYREAIRLRPQFVPGHINLGTVLLAMHRRGEAAEALCAALRIEPDNLMALTKLGQALRELRDPDLVDEAETHCRHALALAPRVPEVLENLGQVLRLKGRLGEALECYKQGLELAPRSVSIRLSMGELLLGSGVTMTLYGSAGGRGARSQRRAAARPTGQPVVCPPAIWRCSR